MKHTPCRVLRGPGPVAVRIRCRRARRRTCGGAVVAYKRTACRDPWYRPARESLPSAQRGLYRAVTGTPTRRAWVAVSLESRGGGSRACLGLPPAGSCAGGVQPVLEPVVAVAGDVVVLGPEAVIVNGRRLPGSLSSDLDSLGRPAAARGLGRAPSPYVPTLVSTRWSRLWLAPNSTTQRLIECVTRKQECRLFRRGAFGIFGPWALMPHPGDGPRAPCSEAATEASHAARTERPAMPLAGDGLEACGLSSTQTS